jgi:hypothetical protein
MDWTPPGGLAGEDDPRMTQSGGVPQIDRALANVVGAINALTERQDDGPGVVLTLGGVVVSGTVVPDWQWFDEVEHAARAAFVVHTGGSVDDEHGGWASLFEGVAESLVQARDEYRAAREATKHLSDRYQSLHDQIDYADLGPATSSMPLSSAAPCTRSTGSVRASGRSSASPT